MRGFLGGVIWGVVAIVAFVAVISLLAPLPSGPDVATDAPTHGGQAADPSADSGVGPAGVDADLVNAAPTVPGGATQAPDTLANMDGADTDPAARPVVGGDTSQATPDSGDTGAVATGSSSPLPASGDAPAAPGAQGTAPDDLAMIEPEDTRPVTQPDVGEAGSLNRPEDHGQSGGVTVNADSPVDPSGPGTAPAAPMGDTDRALSSDPAQPVMPSVSDAGSGFGTAPEAELSPDVSSADDAASAPAGPADAMSQPGAGDTPTASSETAAAPVSAPTLTPSPSAGDADTSQVVAPAPQTQPSMPTGSGPQTSPDATEPAPSVNTAPATQPAPRVAALPQAGADADAPRPSIGTPVVPLTERQAAAAPDSPVAMSEPPIVMYSEPFENPEEKPLMAIVLIDDEHSIGVEALANFPQPITMAVNPAAPDAAEKMARHRAAGFEVVALIDLPGGATAQDAEVALSASFAEMPEVVAVLEGTGTGVQGNRALADQVSAIAAETGHGLILQNNGLNTVFKLAVRAGIPAGVIFRDFDGAGQTGAVMRRFLDQAAFRAGQEGAVIMLGRVRPDTVSALLLWALQDRATRVVLAPISAVLITDKAQ